MKIFEFTPEKNTKKLSLVTGLLIIGAAVLMAATMITENLPYRWAIQLLALGMLAMGIFFTTRYVMKSYVYAVIKTDDGNDFTVTEIQGRHTITVCRIGLSGIERAVVVHSADREADSAVKKQIRAEKRKHFNYCADLFAEKYMCLFVNECGEELAIKLSYDECLDFLADGAQEENAAQDE